MQLTQAVANITTQWNLLENPFYQAWSHGTLSTAALQRYASEYGHFIALLPLGWQSLGDTDTASEEQEHLELWSQFSESIQAVDQPIDLIEVKQLIQTAQNLFTQPATAMGALYAFEVQQPQTATSKLAGLRNPLSPFGS